MVLVHKLANVKKSISSYIRLVYKDLFGKKTSIKANNNIVLLNTELDSDNLGDSIIMNHCRKVLEELFPEKNFIEIASHTFPSTNEINLMFNAKAVIVCGTNILGLKMERFSVWRFSDEMCFIPNLVLMGIGADGYGRFTPYSKRVWRKLLNNNYLHSVRDEYTLQKLKSIGIDNVCNTNCVTLWGGIDRKCVYIPEDKAENVIFTVTGYKNDIKHDGELIDILQRNYNKLYFWPQGETDLDYFQRNFDYKNITILERSLEAYNNYLDTTNLDYVGSRLHGGIHALYHNKRTIILIVDNRAREIARDTDIPVLEIDSIGDALEDKINSSWKTQIHINNEAIEQWKKEIKKLVF